MDIRPPPHVMAWLGPLIIVNIFIWIIFWTPEATAAICAKSNNCLTDWLGSLGGWVAAGAAYLTIRAMNEQRREADIHQRQFVELEIMSRLALSRRLLRDIGHRPSTYRYLRSEAEACASDDPLFKTHIAKHHGYLDILQRELGSQVLQDFDERIGLNSRVVGAAILKMITNAREAIERYQGASIFPVSFPENYEASRTQAAFRLAEVFHAAAEYFGDAVADANGFIESWHPRIVT